MKQIKSKQILTEHPETCLGPQISVCNITYTWTILVI